MADTKHVILIPRAMDTQVIGPFDSYDEADTWADTWADKADMPIAFSIEPITPREDYD